MNRVFALDRFGIELNRPRWSFSPMATLSFLCVTLTTAFALGAGVTVTVDRNQATVEDQIQMVVEIEGGRGEPTLPDLSDFQVYNRGRSSQTNIVNGRVSSSISYNFILVPNAAGKFHIGPASANIDGKLYQSRPFVLTILGASEKPKEQSPAFLKVTVSTREPYVGAQIIYTWRLYRRVRLAGAEVSFPEFAGVVVEDLGEQRDFKATIDGQTYEVSEITKALFATKAGTVTIPGSQIAIDMVVENSRQRGRGSVFDDFFSRGQTKRRVLKSDALELNVRNLPPAPKNFSGLVGEFGIQAKLSKNRLHVGESTTFTIAVQGSGNWKSIGEPQLDLRAFKTYSDKSTSHPGKSKSEFSGKKIFKQALVPLEPGKHAIESFSLTYFSPSSGEYKKARSPRFVLHVSPAAESENLQLTENRSPGMGKVAVRVLADDILPLKPGLSGLQKSPETWRKVLELGLGLTLPAFAFLGLAWRQKRQELHASNSGLRRRKVAMAEAKTEMKTIRDSQNPLAAGSRVLRHYLGNQLNLEGGALTSSDVQEALLTHGVSPDLAQRVRKFLSQCELSQFGSPTEAKLSAQKVADTVELLLKDLQQSLGGNR